MAAPRRATSVLQFFQSSTSERSRSTSVRSPTPSSDTTTRSVARTVQEALEQGRYGSKSGLTAGRQASRIRGDKDGFWGTSQQRSVYEALVDRSLRKC